MDKEIQEIHEKSYEAAIQELSELMEMREELESKLETVEHMITRAKWAVRGISYLTSANPETEYPHLFPEVVTPDVGFTDAIREVLQEEPGVKYSAPVHVRNALELRGFNIKKYKNPLASIHTILKRLEKSGEAKTIERDGRLMYTGVVMPRREGIGGLRRGLSGNDEGARGLTGSVPPTLNRRTAPPITNPQGVILSEQAKRIILEKMAEAEKKK
jgi:hypothetical protein